MLGPTLGLENYISCPHPACVTRASRIKLGLKWFQNNGRIKSTSQYKGNEESHNVGLLISGK